LKGKARKFIILNINEENETVKSGIKMEVHHHPHVEKKGFKEYFLEFLMIFLAVTLGFFAEGLRESISDHSTEKEYIVSIIQDMKKDSATLTNYIYKSIPYHSKWLDSEINLLQKPLLAGKDKEIYQAFIIGNLWTYDFFKTARTISQLNAEGFRLIRNQDAANAITDWESQLDYNNITLAKAMELQSDIDVSANIFADKYVTNHLSGMALSKLPGLVSLDLSDIPKTAHISKPDPRVLDDYIKKLKVYNYFLISNLQQEYKFDVEVLTKTLNKLETAYKIGDHKKRLTSTN
jgi:hypothetical protein